MTVCAGCGLSRVAATTVATDAGPVELRTCPVCDRRRCQWCHQVDVDGRSVRCTRCGHLL